MIGKSGKRNGQPPTTRSDDDDDDDNDGPSRHRHHHHHGHATDCSVVVTMDAYGIFYISVPCIKHNYDAFFLHNVGPLNWTM